MYLVVQPRKTAAFRTETIREFGVHRSFSVVGCCVISFLQLGGVAGDHATGPPEKNFGGKLVYHEIGTTAGTEKAARGCRGMKNAKRPASILGLSRCHERKLGR